MERPDPVVEVVSNLQTMLVKIFTFTNHAGHASLSSFRYLQCKNM